MRVFRTILFIIYGNLTLSAFSQKLVEHEKKMYEAPDGKLYFPKSMPMYLFISLSKDDKNPNIFLQNEGSPKEGAPIYLKSEGLNTFRTPSAVDPVTQKIVYPRRDVVFEVYADGHPPITRASFGNAKILNKGGKLFMSGKVEITLTSRDEISGIDKVLYSIDSSDYKEYTSPIILDSPKEYLIKYYSIDHVGNAENLKDVKVVIDRTKPKTSFEIRGDKFENVLAGNSSIMFSASHTLSGIATIRLKLDGKPFQNFSGIIRCALLNQGEHKVEYYAEDNVGNQEDPQVYDFYVDRTAPTILQDIIGKTFMSNGKEYSSGRSQLKLTALDNKAGVKALYYSINNSEYKLYEKPVFLNAVKGKMSIKAYAVDKVNNKSQATEEANEQRIPYVDLTGPVMKYKFAGPVFSANDTIYVSSKTKILFTGVDNESGINNIQYTIDNKENIPYSAPVSIDKEGVHSIDYIGTDNVDNTTTSNLKVMVDNTGPIIFPRFSTAPKGSVKDSTQTLDIYPSHVCLFIAATDIESGYDHMTYALNGAPEKLFSGFINNFSKMNKIIIRVYDKLGNESSLSLSFKVSN